MNTRLRIGALLLLATLGSAASAQVTFSSIAATYQLNTTGPINYQVVQDALNGRIDFIGAAPAFKVGDGTGASTGTSTITYNVTSSTPITYIDLLLQGDRQLFGQINYSETATSGAGSLGSISGTLQGSSYTGGADGAFTFTRRLTFSQAVTSFSITKTFSMNVNGQSLPSTSVATLSLVEQNLSPVPEPATLTALSLGAVALLRRRKK